MKYFYEDKITREYFLVQRRHMIFMASQITGNKSLDHLFNHLFKLKRKKASKMYISGNVWPEKFTGDQWFALTKGQ